MSPKPNNPFGLEDRRILVTGASSGIGRAISVWLGEQGAQLVLVGRNSEEISKTLALLPKGDHLVEIYDFLGDSDTSVWLKDIAARFGSLDGLVHAAGIHYTLPIRATSREQWDDLMTTNVTSAFSLIKGFRQKGVYSKNASIVLISSVMAKVGQPGLLAYCSSKGAIDSMVRAAALELAQFGIRVNSIAPGTVETPMAMNLESTIGVDAMKSREEKHPLGFGNPSDVAYAANYLLSPAARWITGISLDVDGGYLAE